MKKKVYDKAFKERAVKLSYERDSVSEVALELGVGKSTLGKWRQEFESYGNNSFPGKGKPLLTDDQRRIKELEKELMDSKLDLEILKKAIAFLSRTDK